MKQIKKDNGRVNTGKSADQAFSSRHTANDTARGNTFDGVLAIPGNQVIIVDDKLFTLGHLRTH